MRAPDPSRFARALAFFLVHFCSSATLARVERAIIEEVISRKRHAIDGHPSPANLVTRWRVWRATRHLRSTLEGWKWEASKNSSRQTAARH
jgi:hypothetical protein